MDKKEIREKIADLSLGVLVTLADLILYDLVYFASLLTEDSRRGGAYRASEKAFRFIEKINKETIKRAIWQLSYKGFVKKKGRHHWQVTKAGLEKLNQTLPFYDKKRYWDRRIYLITYDIEEKRRKDRDLLREYLKKLGCGMLQASVWITPYDPREVLKKFIKERNLSGAILISDLGEEGSIGEEDVRDLLSRVYKLDRLNERYREFIEEAERLPKGQASFLFLSILADDPQLPFPLLPFDWQGDKAYRIYRKIILKSREGKR